VSFSNLYRIHTKAYGVLFFIVVCLSGLTGCNNSLPFVKPTNTVTPTPTASPTPTPTVTLTPTPLPPIVILLNPPGADSTISNAILPVLSSLAEQAGFRFQTRANLNTNDFDLDIRLVVIPVPIDGIDTLVKNAPNTQFLTVGIPGLRQASNLSTIGAEGIQPDQQGFIAGVIAAIMTTEWRVGAITIADNIPGKANRQGFLNGVVYFCGLCGQNYPPFYQYPLYIELPQDASSIEWQAAANYMVDHYVKTLYIAPGIQDTAMFEILAQAGIAMIGEKLPSPELSKNWAVSLISDPLPLVMQVLPDLIQGKGGFYLTVPLDFSDINPELFSPGRQILAGKILADLIAGIIDTGVNPETGENH